MARFPEVYRTNAWKKSRRIVIMRSNGLCEKCYPEFIKPGKEVDHIQELTEENKTDWNIVYNPDNLQYLCTDCHNNKHERSIGLQKFLIPPISEKCCEKSNTEDQREESTRIDVRGGCGSESR